MKRSDLLKGLAAAAAAPLVPANGLLDSHPTTRPYGPPAGAESGANRPPQEVSSAPTVLNVRSFGAVGDGTTDDTAAVQAALDAVTLNGDGTVYLPAGSYRITESLVLLNLVHSRATIRGENQVKTRLQFASTSPGGVMLRVAETDNLHLENMTLFNTKAAPVQGALSVTGSPSRMVIRNIEFDGWTTHAIDVGTLQLSVIERCRFINCSNALSSGGDDSSPAVALRVGDWANGVTVRDSAFTSNDRAIDFAAGGTSYAVTVESCSFEHNGDSYDDGSPEWQGTVGGQVLIRNCRGFTFAGNYVEANRTGSGNAFLDLDAVHGAHISGNSFHGAAGSVTYTDNTINFQNGTIGVMVAGNSFEEVLTKFFTCVSSTCRGLKAHCNRYVDGGSEITTYVGLAARMDPAFVEIDLPHVESWNPGRIGDRQAARLDITAVRGVRVDRGDVIAVNYAGSGMDSEVLLTAHAHESGSVVLVLYNVSRSARQLGAGDVVVRVFKQ